VSQHGWLPYRELKNIFWNLQNPLNEDMMEHEIYELMKNNCSYFSQTQIENLLEWIETANYPVPDMIKHDEDKVIKAIAYQKKEWLSALLKANDPKINSTYQKYDEINPAELKYPGLKSWSETSVGVVSPIEPEELIKQSNSEIADYLDKFKGYGSWESPTEEGLSSTFKACISINPEKFSEDMKPFENISPFYQYDLISGFVQAWRSKQNFSWENVFNFIENIISSDAFWKHKDDRDNYRIWTVSQILELIQEGTRTDSNAFDPKYLDQTEKILFIISKKIDPKIRETENLYKAMILYSLRFARLFKKDEKERWPTAIKEYFNRLINQEISTTKYYYKILGQYLVNLNYLDEEWVKKNINNIFPADNREYWEAAFANHVLYTNRVHKEVYLLLKSAGVWVHSFDQTFQDEAVIEHTLQHICVSYMEEWEELDDNESLINVLITRENLTELNEIVRFIGMFNDLTVEKRIRIKKLWKALFKIVDANKSIYEYQITISNLARWIALIDEIDKDTFDWLKLSARYAEVNHNSSFLIENLERLVKVNPKEVGAVYIEMLKANVHPTFEENNIKNIVTTLYDKGQMEDADRICTIYMAEGYDFLKPIYQKYKNLS